MAVPTKVMVRDCLAVAAILLCVASAAAQAQEPASYGLCTVSARGTCSEMRDHDLPCPAWGKQQGHLLWAVAMHREAISDAGIALRTVKPAAVSGERDAVEVAAARTLACSH